MKVADNIKPCRPFGCDEAIFSPIGPEKDSAMMIHGLFRGKN